MKLRPVHLVAFMVLASVAVALWPGAPAHLIYDRGALARGEWWRWVTGHWVHFTASHLLFDILALFIGAQLLPCCSIKRLAVTLAVSAVAIPGAIYCWAPELVRYAGLSGLAVSVLALAAVENVAEGSPTKPIGWIVLALIATKLVVEWASGGFLFATIDQPSIEPATLAHAVGAVVGVLGGFMPRPASVARAGVSRNQQPVF